MGQEMNDLGVCVLWAKLQATAQAYTTMFRSSFKVFIIGSSQSFSCSDANTLHVWDLSKFLTYCALQFNYFTGMWERDSNSLILGTVRKSVELTNVYVTTWL